MENIIDLNAGFASQSLSLNTAAISFLNETRKWGKFLAIIGFISCGVMGLAGLFIGSIFQTMEQTTGQKMPFGGAFGLIYVLLALLYFFPALYLFKYSIKLKTALESRDSEVLAAAFGNEKSMFKFMGILMIVVLSFYALFFLIALVGGLASFM